MVESPVRELDMIVPDGVKQKFRMTASDRADCCEARAYVKVQLESEKLLFFCLHHYTKHKPALLPQVLRVRDETAQLTFNRHVGSSN